MQEVRVSQRTQCGRLPVASQALACRRARHQRMAAESERVSRQHGWRAAEPVCRRHECCSARRRRVSRRLSPEQPACSKQKGAILPCVGEATAHGPGCSDSIIYVVLRLRHIHDQPSPDRAPELIYLFVVMGETSKFFLTISEQFLKQLRNVIFRTQLMVFRTQLMVFRTQLMVFRTQLSFEIVINNV